MTSNSRTQEVFFDSYRLEVAITFLLAVFYKLSRVGTGALPMKLIQATRKGLPASFQQYQQKCCIAFLLSAPNGHPTLCSKPLSLGAARPTRRTYRSSAICNKKNFYDVLGVKKSATKEEIKSKYRDMAKKCHPDLNKDDKNAAVKFRELSEAYEVLENDSKRQMYDTYGTVDQNGGGGQQRDPFAGFGGFGGFGGFQGGGPRQPQGESWDNVFDALNRAMREQTEAQGKDVQMALKLSFLEAVNGCTKDIKYDYMGPDPQNPSKTIRNTKSVNVDIPPGVQSGISIKMTGQGVKAVKGNNVGNLLIELQVEVDPYFVRDDVDIHTDQHISFVQAALGGTIDVLTLDGMVEMKVKAGTQSGTKMSLTGKGVKYLNSSMSVSNRRGNHYVKLVVNTPSSLTERQTELLKEFAELEALKSKDESWTKKFSLLDKAWSRLKSFGGQDAKSK